MPTLSHITTTARAEGGAVRISFGMPKGYPHVRVLRVPEGTPVGGPEDESAHLVWDGPPRAGEPSYRFARNLEGTLERGEIWDLQAFGDRFDDAANLIDGHAWDYYLWPKHGSSYGESVMVKVTPQRSLHAYMALQVKDLVYQRARYHAAPRGVFVLKDEALHRQGPPLLQIAERYVLADIHLGSEDDGDGSARTATFRGIAEARLLARTPAQRDELGDYFMMRFLGDLELFGELGWDELGMSARDNMADLGDALYYTREITLDGIVDAYIERTHPFDLGNVTFAWRVTL
jgi:hypothetical protein